MTHETFEIIYSKAYCDYRSNKASDAEIVAMAGGTNGDFDRDYLEFLKTINGFELNGLNFYGTREQPDIYVLSALKQNEFWSVEIPALNGYFIVADGDMEFYCYHPLEKRYLVLTKATVTPIGTFSNFDLLLDELIRIYGT